jgi:proton-translocating NADH-quinone oxidoreductase chain M
MNVINLKIRITDYLTSMFSGYWPISFNNPVFLNRYQSKVFLDLLFIFFSLINIFLLGKLVNFNLFIVIFEASLVLPFFLLFYKSFFNFTNFWDTKRWILNSFIFSFCLSLFLLKFLSTEYASDNFDSFWVGYTFSPFFELSNIVQNNLNFSYFFYLDGISVFFILLTTFLCPICLIVSWYSLQEHINLFLLTLISLNFFLVNCFFVSNLFYFFIFFEAILFPMFLIIGIWGSRDRKIHAVFQFLLYTIVGSILLYIAIFYLFLNYDSLDYLVLKNIEIAKKDQILLFILLFLSFSFKIPLFPLHIWLPEAHVEAPTFGSIILAGLLLKLGTYGMIRFVIPILPYAVNYFLPLVLTFVIIGLFYTSFSTTRQLDLKKIIAYSSVGHMGFVILGLFTTYVEGLVGSIFLMLGHGIVSSALFLSIGILYDRYHTRNLTDLKSLVIFMPLFGICFLIFTLANISFPGTFNFIAEMSILIALAQINLLAAICSIFSILFILIYAFWLYNRIMYGSSVAVFNKFEIIGKYMDLSKREFFLLITFIFFTFLFGFFPNLLMNYFIPYCVYINSIFE